MFSSLCRDSPGLHLSGQQPDLSCDHPSVYVPATRSGKFAFQGRASVIAALMVPWYLFTSITPASQGLPALQEQPATEIKDNPREAD